MRQLSFGTSLMVHADTQIVDLQSADPSDVSVDRYNERLRAGYAKRHADLEIDAYMPAITKLAATGAVAIAASWAR